MKLYKILPPTSSDTFILRINKTMANHMKSFSARLYWVKIKMAPNSFSSKRKISLTLYLILT
jgi:hypothetical protein